MRIPAAAAVVAGVLYLPVALAGFVLGESETGRPHELHWVTHAASGVVSALVLVALAGLAGRWRDEGSAGTLAWVGTAVTGAGAMLDVSQAALVGLSPLAGGPDGALSTTGHVVAMGTVLILPGMFLIATGVWRRRLLPRSATAVLLGSVPAAAAFGPLLDSLGHPGGDAVLAMTAGASVAWIVWGVAMWRAPASSVV